MHIHLFSSIGYILLSVTDQLPNRKISNYLIYETRFNDLRSLLYAHKRLAACFIGGGIRLTVS